MPGFKTHGQFLVSYDAFKAHYSLFPASDEVVTGPRRRDRAASGRPAARSGSRRAPRSRWTWSAGSSRSASPRTTPARRPDRPMTSSDDLDLRLLGVRRRSPSTATARSSTGKPGLLAGLQPVLAAARHRGRRRGAARDATPASRPPPRPGPYLTYREVLGRRRCAAWAPTLGFEPTDDGGRHLRWVRRRLAGLPRLARPRSPGSPRATGWASSRTATTTCSRPRTVAWASTFDWVVTAQQARGYKPPDRQLRARLRAHRRPARPDPARRPEPVPRPRAGQGARHDDGLDRPAPRPPGLRRDAAGRGDARPATFPDMAELRRRAAVGG